MVFLLEWTSESKHFRLSDDDMSDRRTADDMDAERRQKIAYEYLCRLDEARAWIEECLTVHFLTKSQ